MLLATLAINVAHLGNTIYLLIHFTKKNKQQETSFDAFSGKKTKSHLAKCLPFLSAFASLRELQRSA